MRKLQEETCCRREKQRDFFAAKTSCQLREWPSWMSIHSGGVALLCAIARARRLPKQTMPKLAWVTIQRKIQQLSFLAQTLQLQG